MTRHYTKGPVTVVWNPDKCIHSTLCWRGLGEVFDPRKRPWINMDGADTDAIVAQVTKCPSGALSLLMEDKQTTADTETEEVTTIEVLRNGPLMVYGNIKVKNSNGQETEKHNVTAFCRCGASANKPFCDGSHIKAGFKD